MIDKKPTSRVGRWRHAITLAMVIATIATTCASVEARTSTKADSHKHASQRAAIKSNARIRVPSGPLPPTVMAALARAHVPLSSMSVVVERIGAAVPLVSVNASEPMMPASTMKLVTTFAGL
jgi:D-alanyl-D-alanine carboxypeptidase/D-alanyl-D-alanine-endopeptidase (penicillin-binding protein 4)